MIIPETNIKIKIGDLVITTREIRNDYYRITTGHELRVIDRDDYGFVLKDEISGLIVNHMNNNWVTLKVKLDFARKDFIHNKETDEYEKYIIRHCPNKTDEYSNREHYFGCGLNMNGYVGNNCIPHLNCAKYLKTSDIKSNKILQKHLRLFKLSKLKENDNTEQTSKES